MWRTLKVVGDSVIQIGTVFHDYSSEGPNERHIVVLGPKEGMTDSEICDDLEGIEVVRCHTERDLLIAWARKMKSADPDFVTGYNIFGFDFKYLTDRVSELFACNRRCNKWSHHELCPKQAFYNLGKIDGSKTSWNHRNKQCTSRTQRLSSSALGDNMLHYTTMDGRILFDIQKEIQKGHNLESYKLNDVASNFMRGKITKVEDRTITVDSLGNLKRNDYVSFRTHSNIGEQLHQDGHKFMIGEIPDSKTLILTEPLNVDLAEFHKVEWCLNKDDITPQDIFDFHKLEGLEGGRKRSLVAKYCIQDCELCINLMRLLDMIPNNLAMANVSYVPASFIFLRGQGIKVTSVVTRLCGIEATRVPDLKKPPLMRDYVKLLKAGGTEAHVKEAMIKDAGWRTPREWELEEWYQEVSDIHLGVKGMMGYEGAVVLDPTPGIYLDDPIAVLDYASLYPSSIIEKNLSHETQIEDMDLLSTLTPDDYYTLTYTNWVYRLKGAGNTVEKVQDEREPTKTCYFLKPSYIQRNTQSQGDIAPVDDSQCKGIIPKVLEHLLQARKDTKKRMKSEPDEYKKKVLDGLQLAYKVTANSVYGQLGARTSTIYKMNMAACTTAIGRERIDDASSGVKEWAAEEGLEEPEVVYGDTDSVFVKFSRVDYDGRTLVGKEALVWCMECGQEAGKYITKLIHTKQEHPQQVLESEKTFWPFILISKKRYTGDKYEFDPDTCKRDAMGIVLKRRDNAPIVKHVFGNVIERIMIEKDFQKAVAWLQETLLQIREGEFPLQKFVITKALRGYYKNPEQIAHKVLADRMAERDPGNKPQSNDRIPYAYIKLCDEVLYDTSNPYKSGPRKNQARVRNVKQGDRIEHVDYICEKELPLDYEFYITNQIMNPVKQVLDLEMDQSLTKVLFQSA
jgi:DNA polymerase elongation subunit (family B)